MEEPLVSSKIEKSATGSLLGCRCCLASSHVRATLDPSSQHIGGHGCGVIFHGYEAVPSGRRWLKVFQNVLSPLIRREAERGLGSTGTSVVATRFGGMSPTAAYITCHGSGDCCHQVRVSRRARWVKLLVLLCDRARLSMWLSSCHICTTATCHGSHRGVQDAFPLCG